MSVSRRLDELRHPEVEAYLDSSETPTALIPVGTTEQHGPHLPMGTDSMIPTEICERIAEDTDALVGPPINYGASDMHAGYEGITYLPYRTLATVVRDLAYSLAESGFTDIVFISGHLTNDWAAKVGANQASHDLPEEHYAYAFPYWDALSSDDMEDYLSFDAGWHANIGETAAVMAINEGLVDLSETPYDDPDMPEDIENPGALLDHLPIGKGAFYRVSDTGVWGDPSDATAELGEEYFETITHAVAELINTFQEVRDDIYVRDRPSRAQEQWE
ncbi:creatininase family protein [Halorubrum lacusprofundi]|uniref:Creatininase n=1 Tax=Halorubrum lacusprofundi (strain ATCC 49239 / DSM 5036 / JCM 8891 / ACAM 34) TaxID=416348 RepID=B9LMC5_HALLT|nr:creatininase family protein [Halorubrum lacusprofundi]ACM56513.1 Creatininase [Halorubrum lacusprofundi ATCC 49239]MCG1005215.1 creatininase family protein [Halorubrum lacusprofundi]